MTAAQPAPAWLHRYDAFDGAMHKNGACFAAYSRNRGWHGNC
jgi:hypothetical protein